MVCQANNVQASWTINYNDSAEHTKGKRPSTEEKHEKGKARKQQDQGGEKADPGRRPQRQRPNNWKGPWPPSDGDS